jgi:hypothetical protein
MCLAFSPRFTRQKIASQCERGIFDELPGTYPLKLEETSTSSRPMLGQALVVPR